MDTFFLLAMIVTLGVVLTFAFLPPQGRRVRINRSSNRKGESR